jgi:hypothetical protein
VSWLPPEASFQLGHDNRISLADALGVGLGRSGLIRLRELDEQLNCASFARRSPVGELLDRRLELSDATATAVFVDGYTFASGTTISRS